MLGVLMGVIGMGLGAAIAYVFMVSHAAKDGCPWGRNNFWK